MKPQIEKMTVNNAISANCQVSCDLMLIMVRNGFSRQPETLLVNILNIPPESVFIST